MRINSNGFLTIYNMTNRSAVIVVILVACLQVQAASSQNAATAGTDPSELIELTNDPSRAKLFEFVVAAAKDEQPGPSDRTSTDIPYGLLGPFAFPSDAVFDVTEGKPRKDSIFGIDISHYTPSTIPFEIMKDSKIAFVYTKATQGISFKDGKFSLFWQRLDDLPLKLKIHRGAYHFLTANDDATAQANTFLRFLAANGGLKPTDMPPVLDLEWDKTSAVRDRWAGHDPKEILHKTLTWLRLVQEKTGRTPILYTARSWWRERNIPEADYAQLSDFKTWIADYSKSSRAFEVPKTPNSATWTLWQFSETAKTPPRFGQTIEVDANIYKGTDIQFYRDFGLARFQ